MEVCVEVLASPYNQLPNDSWSGQDSRSMTQFARLIASINHSGVGVMGCRSCCRIPLAAAVAPHVAAQRSIQVSFQQNPPPPQHTAGVLAPLPFASLCLRAEWQSSYHSASYVGATHESPLPILSIPLAAGRHTRGCCQRWSFPAPRRSDSA